MVTYKTIRQNKKFIENPTNTITIKPLTSKEKVEKFLSDGEWHSMKNIQLGTGISSSGNMYSVIYIQLKDDIEISTCEHCDSQVKLYRLK